MKKQKLKINGSPTRWPKPLDLLAEREPEALDPDYIPPSLRDYALLMAKAAGADRNLTLASAITAAAAALHDEVQILANPATGWRQSARLWTLIIGTPGSQKTPMQSKMLEPLWEHHHQMMVDAFKEWKKQPDGERDKHAKKLRLIISDTTVEAIGEILVNSTRGVLVNSEEIASLLGAFDRYKAKSAINKDRGDWLQLYDGGKRVIERIGRGSLLVPNWGASLLTATTPETMKAIKRHLPEDGLMQRFLVFWVRETRPAKEVSASTITRAHNQYEQTIKDLFQLKPQDYKLSAAAKKAFDQWFAQNSDDQKLFAKTAPAYRSHLAKLPNMTLRLALVFHVADSSTPAKEVSLDTLDCAFRFLSTMQTHLHKLYLDEQGSEAYTLANQVASYLLTRLNDPKLARAISLRDILNYVGYFKKAERHLQGHALDTLRDAGWLRTAKMAAGRVTRYEINPALQDLFPEQIEQATRERKARREALKRALRERKRE